MTLTRLILAALGLLLIGSASANPDRPALVLLPINAINTDASIKEQYRIAVQRGLNQRYRVFSGAVVEQQLEKSTARSCDTTECLQEVAIAFQGELIAYVVVTPSGNGAILSLEIKNIFRDAIIESQSENCRRCDTFAIIDHLRQLASGHASSAATHAARTPLEAETSTWSMPWWGWVGVAALIGAVVGGSSSGGDSGSATTPPPSDGNISVNW
jgi:hypothetical protein